MVETQVHRKEQLRTLEKAEAAVVIMAAPAGYGKTTLLRQHQVAAEKSGARTAYVRLNDEYVHASAFADAIAEKLSAKTTRRNGAAGGRASLSSGASISDLSKMIVRLIEESDQNVILYIDEIERFGAESAFAVLSQLLDSQPPNLKVFLSGRTRSQIPLAKRELGGDVQVLAEKELRFSKSEEKSLLGQALEIPEVKKIASKMEGWPAGLSFLKLYQDLSSPADNASPKDVQEFQSWHGEKIFDYLAEQVLSGSSEDICDFLMDISILDSVQGDLANFVTGRTDSWTMLERAKSDGLFVQLIDRDRDWFRLHPLFRQFLIARLRSKNLERISFLHRRAAHWLADNKDTPAAISHALAVNSVKFLDETLRRSGGWRNSLTYGYSLGETFDRFSDLQISKFPDLVFSRAVLLLHRREIVRARRLANSIEHVCTSLSNRDVDENCEYDIDWQALHLGIAYVEEWPAPLLALKRYEKNLNKSVATSDATGTMVADQLSGWIYFLSGEFQRGRIVTSRAINVAQRTGSALIHIYALLAKAMCESALGRIQEVQENIAESNKIANSLLGPGADTTNVTEIFRAGNLLDAGELRKALQIVRPILHTVTDGEVFPEMARQLVRIVGWGAWAYDGPVESFRALDDLSAKLSVAQLERINRLIEIQKVRILLASGQSAQAQKKALEIDLDGDVWTGKKIDCDEWQLSLGASYAQAQICIEEGDLTASKNILGAVQQFVEISNGLKFSTELGLFKSWHCVRSGELENANQLLEIALKQVDEFGYRLPVCVLGGVLNSINRYLSSADALSVENRIFLSKHLQGANSDNRQVKRFETQMRTSPHGLSPREAQVFSLLVDGLSSKEIARDLGISVNTVSGYRKTLYRKLRVSRRSEIVELSRKLEEFASR